MARKKNSRSKPGGGSKKSNPKSAAKATDGSSSKAKPASGAGLKTAAAFGGLSRVPLADLGKFASSTS